MSTDVKNPSKKSTQKKSVRKSSTGSKIQKLEEMKSRTKGIKALGSEIKIGEGGYIYNANAEKNDPSRWMTDDSDIRKRTLDQVTMLGSHDSGMSEDNYVWGTNYGIPSTTITQLIDIAGQLKLGVRYFDIRPAYWTSENRADGKKGFYCGHFSNTEMLGWQGAFAQSLSSVIDQINEFCKDKKELIILKIGHVLNITGHSKVYPDFVDNYVDVRDFDSSDWKRLCGELKKIQYLCPYNKNLLCKDISKRKTIGELTKEKSAVVVFDEDGHLGSLDECFCKGEDLNIYDKYANKDEVSEMREDQFMKMIEYGNNPDQLFLLSWTLTQQAGSITTPILKLAQKANEHLYEVVNEAGSYAIFPNIIQIDRVEGDQGFSVVQEINDFRKTDTMYVKMKLDFYDDGKPRCTVDIPGRHERLINDSNAKAFHIYGDELKKAVGKYKGKEPNDAFLHSPTPWGDLYERYDWSEVKLVIEYSGERFPKLEVETASVWGYAQKEVTNNGKEKGTYDVALRSHFINVKDIINYDRSDDLIGTKVLHIVDFPRRNDEEKTAHIRSNVDIGNCMSIGEVPGFVSCQGSVELEPGETVNACLYATGYSIKVSLPFRAYLTGYVAVNYNPTYEGHHFYGIPVGNILKSNGIPNDIVFGAEVKLGYVGNPIIKFEK